MASLRIVEYYAAAVAWFVLYWVAFKYVSPWLSLRMSRTYRGLTEGQRLDWDIRTSSMLNSLITGPISVYLILSDHELGKDPIWGDSRSALHLLAVMVGFTFTDVVNMVYYYPYWRYMGMLEYLIYLSHHVVVLVAYMTCLTLGNLPYFAVFRLTCENSTFFVNTKWLLERKGVSKASKPYVYNGMALAVSWFLFRIAIIPPYWYTVYLVYDTAGYNRLHALNRYVWFVTCMVLEVLNIQWFGKIVKGGVRVLQRAKQAES